MVEIFKPFRRFKAECECLCSLQGPWHMSFSTPISLTPGTKKISEIRIYLKQIIWPNRKPFPNPNWTPEHSHPSFHASSMVKFPDSANRKSSKCCGKSRLSAGPVGIKLKPWRLGRISWSDLFSYFFEERPKIRSRDQPLGLNTQTSL